jgi:hypothetical protein
MKALCITGADNSTLEAIAAPFYKAGMQPPKSLKREKEVSFARWHQQVGDTLAKKQPIGKLWENLASDLLLVNLESELWGWYEEQSVKALDFWADLEPSIHFLLVCTRPEDELCQKISQTEGSVDAEAFIKEWHQRHKKLLQFYLKHPQRCLLIDAQDALQHLNKQLLLAHDHWQLPLDQETAEQQVETPAESAQAQENAQEQTSGIVSLVAREALKKVSIDITDFYTELRAAQYPLNGLEESEATTRKLFDWLREDIDLTALNQLLTEYRALQQQATLASKLPMLENQSQNIRQQLEEGKQENKLLLLQLQQVKEELQFYFQKNQTLQAELEDTAKQKEDALHQNHLNFVAKEDALHQNHLNVEAKKAAELKVEEIRHQLDEGKQENELLLLQLHQVQEELETYFVQNQNLNKKQQELQTALQEAAKQKENALHQNHLNAEAKKAAQEQVAAITQEYESLLKELHKTQVNLEKSTQENHQLSRMVKQLQSANEQYKQSWAGRLVKAPAPEKELVYQDLELTHEQVNSDYEHLLINLKNPAFGAATASQWSFCLSCAAVKPGAFGQQPKLELPEQKEQLLHKWFEESVSEHGPKLELRFALPGSMDTSVWKQIEQHDQKLIRSLIEQLPQILGELKQKGTPISRSWEDWERLASDMNRIHQSKVSK